MECLLSSEKDILVWGVDQLNNEVLPILDDSPPHVALIDVDGFLDSNMSVVRKIKQSLPNIGVIVFTSSLNNALILWALKSQVAACLDRNANNDNLLEIIRCVANGKYPINDVLTSQSQVAEDVLREFEETSEQYGGGEIFAPLSPREITILEYVAKGYFNKRIALELGISDQTVKNHVTSILRKLNANSRTEAVMVAISQSIIAIN
jgi:DNA-binding NarL/FixJ family response regulator